MPAKSRRCPRDENFRRLPDDKGTPTDRSNARHAPFGPRLMPSRRVARQGLFSRDRLPYIATLPLRGLGRTPLLRASAARRHPRNH
jgi:hypothetical protein